MRRSVLLALVFFVPCVVEPAFAQQSNGCSLPAPPLKVHRANIFSDQQAQWLGDAQQARVVNRSLLLPEAESAYLTGLGQKLLAQLPSTALHYSFRVYESDGIQSFSLAGGQVYVSRKLILDARSEDELAGVLAHEIGRVYTGHIASVYTLNLDKLMGVKSLGDQADVADKLERLLNIPRSELEWKWNPRLSIDDEEHDERIADQAGLYAYVKAGYAPPAYVSLMDRVTWNQGYWGDIFTDILDASPELNIRIRAAKKMAADLPEACRNAAPQDHPLFTVFRDWTDAHRIDPIVAATSGLRSIGLDPPMSPALENVRLSPDAKYILAQDEWQVHVLSRDPLQVLFSIDALGAQMAQFTLDSADVLVNFTDLRFEDWDVATHRPRGILDFTDYVGCLQSSLSPDGSALACFSRDEGSGWLKISDLRTGKLLWENPNFYTANFQAQAPVAARRAIREPRQGSAAWSQDGRFFVASSGTASVAFDISTGKVVKMGNDLSRLYESRLAFVDSNKIVFECDWGFKEGGPRDTFKMCYTTFPEGNPLGAFTLGRMWMSGVTSGAQVLSGPSASAAATVLDPANGAASAQFKLETVDIAGDVVAAEAEQRGISTGQLGGSLETIALPVTPLSSLEAAEFSADGRFLAVSDRARGAVWDLAAGRRVSLTGPFRNAQFDAAGKLDARVADHELKPARDIGIDRRTGKVAPTLQIAAEKIQYGSVVVQFRALESDQRFDFNVELDADDAATGARLWSRRFPHNAPELIDTDGDQLLLIMDRRSDTGGDEVDHNGKVAVRTSDEIKEFQERGLVIEVLSRRTGQVERLVVAPETASARANLRTARLYGDLLAVRGAEDNTVVYRLSDGARLMACYGMPIAGDAGLGLIAVANAPQEVTVYEAATGKVVQHVMLDHYVRAARFIPEKHELLVLSATQKVYSLDVAGTMGSGTTGSPTRQPAIAAERQPTR